jgi:long-chain acyl-CoA synthetase
VLQGYGLTETLCGGTITHPSDVETGNAGAPVACCQVKLVDEKEMGYTHADKPKSRGQIYIGGPNVSVGYYEQDKLTAEAYFTDSGGLRYFATGQAQRSLRARLMQILVENQKLMLSLVCCCSSGDIGEWQDNGTLKIIDRKKDLVKLAHGEYIAVGQSPMRNKLFQPFWRISF